MRLSGQSALVTGGARGIGQAICAALAQEGPGTGPAVNRLKNLLWGGNTRSVDQMRPRLIDAGFDPVIRAPGGRSLRMICARRPNLRELP